MPETHNRSLKIRKVSELPDAETLKNLNFFAYAPPLEDEKENISVQVPYSLFQSEFNNKQNKLKAGTLVQLVDNANNTTTVNVQSDTSKQNKLVNTDGTIKISDLSDGTTDIKVVPGTESIQTYSQNGEKIVEVSEKIVHVTSSTSLKVTGIKSDLNYITIINGTSFSLEFSLGKGGNTTKLLQTDAISSFFLSKNRVAHFFRKSTGWLLLKETTYFPDLATNSDTGKEYNVLINEDGTSKREVIENVYDVDESVTASMKLAQLNEKYPNAVAGFTVLGDGVMFVKSSNIEQKWQKLILNTVN